MYGDLGDGRQAFMDFTYLGSCEKMDLMYEKLIAIKEQGTNTIQESVEALFPSTNGLSTTGLQGRVQGQSSCL